MKTLAIFSILVVLSSSALAQTTPMTPVAGMDHSAMMGAERPQETGQSAFAALQEIVALLVADPNTDWTKVNIEGLRQHLIDMNNVTLLAKVDSQDVPGGVRFTVSGEGPARDSIRRMVKAHAATMSGAGGWSFTAKETDTGAELTVMPPANVTIAEVHGLSFIGLLTLGMHHQIHHLMIAKGMSPHG